MTQPLFFSWKGFQSESASERRLSHKVNAHHRLLVDVGMGTVKRAKKERACTRRYRLGFFTADLHVVLAGGLNIEVKPP